MVVGEREGARVQEPVQPSDDPTGLTALINRWHAADDADRPEAARAINELLIEMRAPGHEAEEAKALLSALDLSRLDGAKDAQGRDCRKEAVESLIACGFPHALNLSPDDLQYARAREPLIGKPPATMAPGATAAGSAIALLGGLLEAYGAFQLPFAPLTVLAMFGGLSILVGGAWIADRQKKREEAGAAAVVLVVGTAASTVAAVADPRVGFVAGAFAGFAALVLALVGSKELDAA